ncbi:MAG: DNA topoisomerase I [bacterium]|nr:DNA topoisomerase I [bacterium]
MIFVVTEKNIAAAKIAELLSEGPVKSDKVYNLAVYRFKRGGEDWVSLGLRGHILRVDFADKLEYSKRKGWYALDEDGNVIGKADIPKSLEKPPFKRRKPFYEDGVELSSWKIPALPYLVYAPIVKYPAEKDIIRSLKNLAGKADRIIIATDFDREGELIGADAVSMIREVTDVEIKRARYSALTKGEITEAFSNLVELDEGLAQAGESRQHIDLIWGAALTRYMTLVKYGGLRNVRPCGRVQTPTLALIVARERERLAFVPEDYWVIKAKCLSDGIEFPVTHRIERFNDEVAAKAAFDKVKDASSAIVTDIERKTRTIAPPTPFNTTSLQATAASEGISPARTMRIAESLYMSGYISYPRVDNTVYPGSIDFRQTLSMLSGNPAYAPYAKKLLAKGKLKATRGKTQTTDHPPIHPTGCPSPDSLKAEEWKLYNLIARRFMATLSDAAKVEGTKISLDVEGEPFIARGDNTVQTGFREIYPYGTKKEDELPSLSVGQVVGFCEPELQAKQTEPPARYSQGKLIQEMEKLGLGTKSTRHSIIERLLEVHYIQGNPIEPTQLGMALIDALGTFAPPIVSPEMTAKLEEEMSAISVGEDNLEHVVNQSRDMLDGIIESLIPKKEEVGSAISDAVQADSKVGVCPKCGHDLLLKSSARTRSQFIGCSAWPDCDVTYPVPQGKIQPVEEPCPECGAPQIEVIAFRSRPRKICVDPECKTNSEPDIDIGACPKCAAAGKDAHLIAQKNPKTLKRFIRCQNYEECGVSYPLPQNGKLKSANKVCPDCGVPMVVVSTRRGPWELCPNMECPSKERDESASKKKGTRGRSKAKSAKK